MEFGSSSTTLVDGIHISRPPTPMRSNTSVAAQAFILTVDLVAPAAPCVGVV
jgi:hypothetical protein